MPAETVRPFAISWTPRPIDDLSVMLTKFTATAAAMPAEPASFALPSAVAFASVSDSALTWIAPPAVMSRSFAIDATTLDSWSLNVIAAATSTESPSAVPAFLVSVLLVLALPLSAA